MMQTTQSKDGTKLAYEELGSGPALLLIDGALCGRTFGPAAALAKALSDRFTVFYYDRRGRSESGDTAPYDVEREVDDLAAIIERAGGCPYVYGTSSGAVLALRGAGRGLSMKKLVVYEPPFALDGTHAFSPPDYRERIVAHLAAGERDLAVKLFMKAVGVPAFGIFMMRMFPNIWPHLRASAHTLPYDFAVLGDTQRGAALPVALQALFAAIAVPTLALAGGKSPAWMHHASQQVASCVPNATFRIVPGQTHTVAAKAIAPVISEFFAASSARVSQPSDQLTR